MLWGRLGPLGASAAEWGGRAAAGEAQAPGVPAPLTGGRPVLPAESGPRKLREALRLGLHAPASTRHLSLAALYTSVRSWGLVRTGKRHPLIFAMRAVLCVLLVKGGTEAFEGSEGIRVSRVSEQQAEDLGLSGSPSFSRLSCRLCLRRSPGVGATAHLALTWLPPLLSSRGKTRQENFAGTSLSSYLSL